MNTPTLSVMMPNYNHARFIPEALDSILAQSHRPLEIVILDDGSTDGSVEVIERYRRRAPDLISLVRNETNLGVIVNAGHLLARARGDFVYFAAMDDRVLPGFFERSMQLLTMHPDAGLCSTLSAVMDEKGRGQGLVRMPIVLSSDGYIPPTRVMPLMRRHGNWFMGNTTIFNARALRGAGGFRAELGPYCDGFVSIALAAKHGACFIPTALASWRRMETAYSHTAYADIERRASVLARAEALMRGEFSDRFSPEDIDNWRREMLYGLASFSVALPAAGVAGIERLVPPTTWVDRVFHAVGRKSGALARVLAKPYLFMRLRRPFWQLILRRLAYMRLSSRAHVTR